MGSLPTRIYAANFTLHNFKELGKIAKANPA